MGHKTQACGKCVLITTFSLISLSCQRAVGRGGKIISLCSGFQQKLSPRAALRVWCPTWDLSPSQEHWQLRFSVAESSASAGEGLWVEYPHIPQEIPREGARTGISCMATLSSLKNLKNQVCTGAEMQSYRDCHREGVFPGLNCNTDGDRASREIQTSRSSKTGNNLVLKHRYIENRRRL